MVDISFTDDAIDDLRRIGPASVPRVLKKLLILLTDPKAGYPLGGELTGYRKLVVGRNTWRIVYRVTDEGAIEICEVWAIGARADAEVYAKASARVREASVRPPALIRLADAIERLGALAGNVEITPVEESEPVPDWLAERLIHTVGLAREEVATLDLQQAFEVWTAYISKPRS